MSRKMKQIMLAVILMVMMCAVSPARKVSAEVLNSPQQIVWGQSYSGELEDAQNTYEYTFTTKKSGNRWSVWKKDGGKKRRNPSMS